MLPKSALSCCKVSTRSRRNLFEICESVRDVWSWFSTSLLVALHAMDTAVVSVHAEHRAHAMDTAVVSVHAEHRAHAMDTAVVSVHAEHTSQRCTTCIKYWSLLLLWKLEQKEWSINVMFCRANAVIFRCKYLLLKVGFKLVSSTIPARVSWVCTASCSSS